MLIVVSSVPVEFLRNEPCSESIALLSMDWICLEISKADPCKRFLSSDKPHKILSLRWTSSHVSSSLSQGLDCELVLNGGDIGNERFCLCCL